MKVAVVGMGFVGLSLAVVLASKGVKVYGVEKEESKLEQLSSAKPPFYEPDLGKFLSRTIKSRFLQFSSSIEDIFDDLDVIFVTVGTPTVRGKIDLKHIKNVTENLGITLGRSTRSPLVVIKSTIAPGTTKNIILPMLEKLSGKNLGKDLFLATNPEFLREGSAIHDQIHPHVIVIGSQEVKSHQILEKFYNKIYEKSVPRIQVNFATSELIKYTNNAFLATKISFINTISNLCQKIPGTNVDTIAKVIGMDPRIGPLFLKAGPGYGGSCLPKDLDSLISTCEKIGSGGEFFKSVKTVNEMQIRQVLDILKQKIPSLKGRTISILGLAFKENSDDIRESRSISLIKELLKGKCIVKVHDPQANENTKNVFKNKILYYDKISDCLAKSDCAIIMTPWSDYKNLKNENFEKMRNKIVIDTRRVLDYGQTNLNYVAMGIGN